MWLFLPWKFITRFDSLKTISFLNRWTWTRIIQFNEIIHYSLNRWPADKLHLTNLFVAAQMFPAFFMETNHVVNDTFCFIVQFFQTSFYYYFFKKIFDPLISKLSIQSHWFDAFIVLMLFPFFSVCDLIYLGDFIVDLLFWACFCFGFKSNRVLLWFIWICFVFGFGHWIVTVGR